MKLIIIIPAFNEEKTIGEVIKSIPEPIDGFDCIEIVVVDDGSEDNTAKIVKELGLNVVSHRINKGVGSTFHTGLKTALKHGADVIVNIDADGQFNPADIPKLVKPILEGKADFVTASRFKDKSKTPRMSFLRKWGNRRMANIISFLTGQKFYDVSCGFRAYSRETALRLNLFGKFTYTQETFLDLAYKDASIMEIPLEIKGNREYGKSNISTDLFSYALRTLRIISRTFRDYNPMKFFSLISALFIIPGICLEVFLITHYILTGAFTPHIWAGFTGAFVFSIGLLVLIVGLIADMLDRIRANQEEILYNQKKNENEK